jgi:hypothetical protein
MSGPTRFRAFVLLAVAGPFLAVQTVAHAGVIGAEQYLSSMDRRAIVDSVTATLAREDVRSALKHHGVDPAMAEERVAALNDEELMLLHDQLEELPAGGSLLGALGIAAIVILILELVGAIDIFKKF